MHKTARSLRSRSCAAGDAQALEKHLATLTRPADVTEEAFEAAKQQARTDARLTVTLQGGDGEQLAARSVSALQSLPDRMTWIYFDSAAALQSINHTPLHRFSVRLDFTEPPGFDRYNPWDQPTPNTSKIEVIGSDQTWVTGVYESILSFFRKRRRRRGWLHTQQTFNAANWLVGFPASLWIVFRLSGAVHALSGMHPALSGAVYVYVFLLGLLGFRLGIGVGSSLLIGVDVSGCFARRSRPEAAGASAVVSISVVRTG